jgi:hypothetical protein
MEEATMQNNNNNSNDNEEQEEPIHITAEPTIAVFIHENEYYVSTPDTICEEYYKSLGALLNKIYEDTPQMFEELKNLINDKDFDNKVN